MEAIYSSETSVDFQGDARRYVPEDSILHSHRCENIRFFILALTCVQYTSLFIYKCEERGGMSDTKKSSCACTRVIFVSKYFIIENNTDGNVIVWGLLFKAQWFLYVSLSLAFG
jgi:hypothetical protein